MKPHRPRHYMSKILTCLISCTLLVTLLHAQVSRFPLDNQLYPRDLTTNRATVSVAGTVSQSTYYRQMRLYVYRDGIWISTKTVSLTFYNKKANYQFSVEIPAERNNYRFVLYGVTSWGEKLIRTANNVVAGDAYIIQGQSNAVANLRGTSNTANNADDPTNAPNRNFVRVYGSGSSTLSYTKAWFIGRGNVWYDVDGQIGQWGMRLGSNLVSATNVPVAIINGAMPGVPLTYFQRNDGSPKSTSTNYGRLLTRVEEAGLKDKIRALFWYQGESDSQGFLSSTQLSTQQYKDLFTSLHQDWKSDYKGLNKFYILQIRHGCGVLSPDNTLKIQEAQRQLDKESSEILTISTSNTNQLFETTGIEYCHYNFVDGYKNMGDWLSKIILRDLFNHSMPLSIEAPEPVSATFSKFASSGAASQVAIQLKDQQTNFTIEGSLINDFRLDGGNFTIQSVTLNNGIIYIDFSRNTGTTINPSSVSYRSHQGIASPLIKNEAGLGLINFEYLPITGEAPPAPKICPDTFEPNNSITTSSYTSQNTTYSASIGSSTDEDWFTIRTWDFPYLKVSLWNLPADYDLFLYNTNGVLLASSTNSGTTAEVINYNDGPPNTIYRVKIVGKNGAFDASACYNTRHTGSSAPFPFNSPAYGSSSNQSEIGSPMEIALVEQDKIKGLRLYPNPANNYLVVEFQANRASTTHFTLVDMAGRTWLVKEEKIAAGPIQYRLNLPSLPRGNYILKINHENMIINRKLIILNQ